MKHLYHQSSLLNSRTSTHQQKFPPLPHGPNISQSHMARCVPPQEFLTIWIIIHLLRLPRGGRGILGRRPGDTTKAPGVSLTRKQITKDTLIWEKFGCTTFGETICHSLIVWLRTVVSCSMVGRTGNKGPFILFVCVPQFHCSIMLIGSHKNTLWGDTPSSDTLQQSATSQRHVAFCSCFCASPPCRSSH